MKRWIALVTLGCLLTAAAVTAAPSLYSDDLVPALRDAAADEFIHVLVLMNPEPDGQAMMRYVQGVRASDRASLVWDRASQIADDAQEDLLNRLYDAEQAGDAHSIRSLKIGNAIDVEARPAIIREMASRGDVRFIDLLVPEQVIPPQEERPADNPVIDEIDWGVQQIGAPDAWDAGYTGQGIVVAVMDTGCNYNHLDLQDHMWDGGVAYPNHGWDFAYGDNNPLDDNGHGSHVCGTVASDGTAGTQAGVAPDAQIMALKVFDSWGSGDYADVWAALDFVVQNGADVVTMSAGWHSVPPATRATFRTHYETLAAANIVSTNSAGNDGDNQGFYPVPDNVKTPASVPPPWLHPDQPANGTAAGQITVGSTNTSDVLSSFSSRGPCTWEDESPWFDFPYAGGTQPGVIKPDVCAPGENIKSCSSTNNSGYTFKTGTSMATPHIAGLAALIKSVDPNLSPAMVDEIMETTAIELGAAGKDNDYGSGRVQAYEAVMMAESYASDVFVNLTPLYDPFIVPHSGGTLTFDAEIRNNFDVNTPGQVRTLAILPNGNEYPLDTYNITYQPGVDIVVNGVTQNVPGMAPDGIYQYVARAGTTPWTMIDDDSFEFRKFSFDTDDAGIPGSEWTSTGWEQLADQSVTDAVAAHPSEFALNAAYPNPFNPTTTVSVSLPETAELNVAVYNVAGQQVATLANGRMSVGQHSFVFDGANLSSGVYFIHASVPGQLNQVRKVTLMK